MKYTETFGDLFLLEKTHYLTHCISSDYQLGKGIATEFNKRYNMRNKLINSGIICKNPECILIDNVFNLITKQYYYLKPTYKTLTISLEKMKKIVISNDIKKIAMPQIGCGLDKLKWDIVSGIIKNTFKDTDVEITICIK